MILNWHSNWFAFIAWAGMMFLCVAILWASEHEEQVKLFFFDVLTCLRCMANGEDL